MTDTSAGKWLILILVALATGVCGSLYVLIGENPAEPSFFLNAGDAK